MREIIRWPGMWVLLVLSLLLVNIPKREQEGARQTKEIVRRSVESTRIKAESKRSVLHTSTTFSVPDTGGLIKYSGTPFGKVSTPELAFDGDIVTGVSSTVYDGYVGLDLGEPKVLSNVVVYPMTTAKKAVGTVQGSNDGVNYIDLAVATEGSFNPWAMLEIKSRRAYRYVRYFAHVNLSLLAVAEVELYGALNPVPTPMGLLDGSTFSNLNYVSGEAAFDGDPSSGFKANLANRYVGLDLGEPKSLEKIRFLTNPGASFKTGTSGIYEGSNDGIHYVQLAVVNAMSTINEGWNEIISNDATPYRFLRFQGNYISLKEIEFYEAAPKDVNVLVTTEDPCGIVSGAGVYKEGQQVTVRAAVKAGFEDYVFDRWVNAEGENVSQSEVYTFQATENVSLQAIFRLIPMKNIVVNWDVGMGNVIIEKPQVRYGESTTLNAIPKEGYRFVNWVAKTQVAPGEFVFYELGAQEVLTLEVTKDYFIEAAFEPAGTYTVTFKDLNGYVIETQKVAHGGAAMPPEMEDIPKIAGLIFNGWDQIFGNVTSDLTVTAKYTVETTQYTVKVSGGRLEDGGAVGEYAKYDKVTLIAEVPEDMVFNCWMSNGVVVGYDETFSFAVSNDVDLLAVFVNPNEPTIKRVPLVTLESTPVVIDDKVTFTARMVLPEGFTKVECGVLLYQTESQPVELTLNTDGAIRGVSYAQNTFGQFAVSKINVADGQIWYGRAYLIYRDLEGNLITIYSDVTAEEKDELSFNRI